MYILGINCFLHDASAALLKDGKIVAAAEEERFTRKKHDGDFPRNAISYCLEETNIEPDQIDYIGVYMKPNLMLGGSIYHALRHPAGVRYALGLGYRGVQHRRIGLFVRKELNLNGRGNPKLVFIRHHIAHAASTYFSSSFDESAVLTIDGSGELDCTMFAHGKGNKIKIIKTVKFPHSLGMVYSSVTKYLGFRPDSDEYKVMGLASYGKPQFIDEFRKIIKLVPGGGYKVDLSCFDYWAKSKSKNFVSTKFIDILGPERKKGGPVEERHMNIAFSLQQVLEETVLYMCEYLKKETRSERLCIAGGVGQNCVMNGKIMRHSIFKDVFVQPAAHDAGTSIGSALHIYHTLLNKPRNFVLDHVYLGPSYDNDYVRKALELCKINNYQYIENVTQVAAKLIAEGKIIGWFQVRMEFGPRALGSRSILANPAMPEMKDLINKYVKHREDFRPFAPSVLERKVGEYFEFDIKSPFMLFVCNVLEEKRDVVPAITHVDGTGRVQTVSRTTNPLYWKLIKEFEKITGIPMILNTSFNVMGEPIVCTPEEAIRCFFSTGIDYLLLGNFLISK